MLIKETYFSYTKHAIQNSAAHIFINIAVCATCWYWYCAYGNYISVWRRWSEHAIINLNFITNFFSKSSSLDLKLTGLPRASRELKTGRVWGWWSFCWWCGQGCRCWWGLACVRLGRPPGRAPGAPSSAPFSPGRKGRSRSAATVAAWPLDVLRNVKCFRLILQTSAFLTKKRQDIYI